MKNINEVGKNKNKEQYELRSLIPKYTIWWDSLLSAKAVFLASLTKIWPKHIPIECNIFMFLFRADRRSNFWCYNYMYFQARSLFLQKSTSNLTKIGGKIPPQFDLLILNTNIDKFKGIKNERNVWLDHVPLLIIILYLKN